MADPDNRDGVAILVAVKTSAPRVIRVNVTLQEGVLAQIDHYAETHGLSRSGFLALAAQRTIEREHG